MSRQEKAKQMKELANERRRPVEELFGSEIPLRATAARTQLGGAENLPPHAGDVAARIALGTAETMDFHALKQLAAVAPNSPWFDIARAGLPIFPPALDAKSRVWVSDKGSLYHRYEDCETMWAGKLKAEEEGKEVHGVSSITVEEASTQPGYWGSPLTPCRTCI